MNGKARYTVYVDGKPKFRNNDHDKAAQAARDFMDKRHDVWLADSRDGHYMAEAAAA